MASSACVICLVAPPTVTLSPCEHSHLCAPCAVRLEQSICPSCRARVHSATFALAHPPRRDFPALLAARRARDDAARATAAQVLVAGPPDTHALAVRLVRRWLAIYQPLPESLALGHRQRNPHDELTGLPYWSRFAPNAVVDGTPVRFSWLRFPDTHKGSRGLLADLQSFRPDFLLLAASLHLRHSLVTLLQWDDFLRRALPHALPNRMWLFLAPPKLALRSTGGPVHSTATISFKDDIAAALNSMPMLHRPLTYHVLEPGSWLARHAKKVAQRSVFHACKHRPLMPDDG